jgi:hypothetical protein
LYANKLNNLERHILSKLIKVAKEGLNGSARGLRFQPQHHKTKGEWEELKI